MGFSACSSRVEPNSNIEAAAEQLPPSTPVPTATPSPSPVIPNLQVELLDERFRSTEAPIGNFDFKNYSYELPRGWQNPDGTTEIKLANGRIAPIEGKPTNEEMSDEERAAARLTRRIGMSFVSTRYFDVTGDGQDEAVVILKVETGGAAIPQLVYVYTWNNGKPELIWPFRTGDRADGGLKDVRPEDGLFVIELYGQDRFILGQTETGKITDDIEQLCCPTYYTRSVYKWNGKNFLMQGKRLTFSVADPNAAALENLGDKVNAPSKGKK